MKEKRIDDGSLKNPKQIRGSLEILEGNPTVFLETALTGASEKARDEAEVWLETEVETGSGLRLKRVWWV